MSTVLDLPPRIDLLGRPLATGAATEGMGLTEVPPPATPIVWIEDSYRRQLPLDTCKDGKTCTRALNVMIHPWLFPNPRVLSIWPRRQLTSVGLYQNGVLRAVSAEKRRTPANSQRSSAPETSRTGDRSLRQSGQCSEVNGACGEWEVEHCCC